MADFRRCLYALALVALIAGLTVPASAQPQALECSATATVPQLVRAEGFTELLGDIVIDCVGGVPTVVGQPVPQANIAVNLGVNNTSKLTTVGGPYTEALIIIDEPNSPSNPARPILNCGNTGAPDTNAPTGPGVCRIISIGNPALTYDGTPGTTVVGGAVVTCTGGANPAANAYGCGRPNVFQGRQSPANLPGQVFFLDVPIDPPGTTGVHRIIRITNLRGDATQTGVSLGSGSVAIQADIAVNPSQFLPLGSNTTVTIGRVQTGLQKITASQISLVGCTQNNNNVATVNFLEAIPDAFKPKNIRQVTTNGTTGPYAFTAGVGNAVYCPTSGATCADQNQNVPGSTYETESGFMFPGALNPNPNPPTGLAATSVTANTAAFANAFGNTGIVGAGVANSGTRFILNFSQVPFPAPSLPGGVTLTVPLQVPLTNISSGAITGVAVLLAQGPTCVSGTTGAGLVGYSTGTTCFAGSGVVPISSVGAGSAIYEVLFSDPGVFEKMAVPVTVTFSAAAISTQLSTTTPTVAQVSGGFAPTYSFSTPGVRTSQLDITFTGGLPVPRFGPPQGNLPLFSVAGKCTCNLLFPYVTNALINVPGQRNYDTAIVIANTSLDPGSSSALGVGGFDGLPQSGPVQLWFYSRNKVLNTPAGAPDEPDFIPGGTDQKNTQCTNTITPGLCPGNLNVPAGGYLAYVLSAGGSAPVGTGGAAVNVLLPAAGFTGYMITQASFQYCHAFAYISAQGTLPSDSSISVSYLGLVLDNNQLSPRTIAAGEQLNN